jgi:hypothetical protein
MKHGFLIDGKYHEIGSFETPNLAKHWVENHYRGKKIEYVPLREPEAIGPVPEDKRKVISAPPAVVAAPVIPEPEPAPAPETPATP